MISFISHSPLHYLLAVGTDEGLLYFLNSQSLKILSRGSGDSKVSWYSADNVLQYAHIDIGTTYFQVYASNNQPIQFYTSGSGGLSLTLNADKSATFSTSLAVSTFPSAETGLKSDKQQAACPCFSVLLQHDVQPASCQC